MDEIRTIAAIATAPGRGGIAVVRVSGPEAFEIARTLSCRSPAPGRIAYAALHDSAGRLLDAAVVLAFRSPHSYTGEDVVEFQCHGGSVTPQRILEACFAAGARLARRGEFTERAFLNGKLDLSEAESVIELVDAKTDRAADDALARLNGAKRTEYRALYDRALSLSTTLEHALDISEEELPTDFWNGVRREAGSLTRAIADAQKGARGGRLLREGALVVLAGPPNAGKSSLMNALLGDCRAIVSSTPGTTRDSIEEGLDLDGWPIRLVDTAGLRETGDDIEAEGVKRAEVLVARADIVLLLSDSEMAEVATHGSGAAVLSGEKVLRVSSKCDLHPHEDASAALRVSSVTGEGLEELKRAIVGRLESLAGGATDGLVSTSEREMSLLQSASAALVGTESLGDDLVLLANAVRSCAETLGRLIGATYSSDLLDSLFSHFCVGK